MKHQIFPQTEEKKLLLTDLFQRATEALHIVEWLDAVRGSVTDVWAFGLQVVKEAMIFT